MSFLEVRNVTMRFPIKGGRAEFVALDDVSLSVEPGQFVTLIGHSGCGKSTLLNLIAGLTVPSSGEIH